MRANASKTLGLLVVSLLTSTALAHSRTHVPATHSRKSVLAERHITLHASVKPDKPARKNTAKKPVVHAAGKTSAVHAKLAAIESRRVKARHAVEPDLPTPEPQPPIHVRHNRKQRHAVQDATDADVQPQAAVTPAPAAPVAKAIAEASVSRKPVEKPWAPSLDAMVAAPSPMPALYTKRGRLIVPPALKGSHEILLHQNQMADLDGLNRIQDDDDLDRLRESKMLVAIPSIAGIQTDERLPLNRRYCRPWTAQFLAALARAHYARFHTALQVNSAVRTVAFQQKLLRTNGNAAPAGGETASPHLTGQAIDLAKHGLSMTEIAWLRGYLLPFIQQGKVDVEEEFQQACFHISVYKKYLPQPAEPRKIVAEQHGSGSTLAVAIP